MRTCAKFVYLFKNFQCVLSYHSSSLGRGNINGRILFSTRIFIKTKCQVSLAYNILKYTIIIANIPLFGLE